MIRSCTIGLLLLFTLLSCAKEDHTKVITSNPVAPVITDTSLHSYLALGDSYTIGQSVPETDRYPVQAVKKLNLDGIKFNAPEIIAQTGWTTNNLLNALTQSPPLQTKYDIVTLLIGVNNQYQRGTQQEYAAQFLTLLNKSLQYAGNNKRRVIVLSIPDYSVTPFANGSDRALIARQIDSFNVINKTITTGAGIAYLDITNYSRFAANDPSLIAPDGLHPSGLEYSVWTDSLVPVIKNALQ